MKNTIDMEKHIEMCEEYEKKINDLFQFVQWKDEEPKLIKKILNNCEVVDNEDN